MVQQYKIGYYTAPGVSRELLLPHTHGDYVKHADYAALQAKHDKLIRLVESLSQPLISDGVPAYARRAWQRKYSKIRALAAQLKEQGN